MTTRPDHAAEAQRLLTLIRPTGLSAQEQREFYAYETPANVIAAAVAQIALAQLEEQRTANLIALFREDGPEVFHEPSSDDKDERDRAVGRIKASWLALADDVARRVGLA